MTHVKSLQAGQSSQGTSEPITPAPRLTKLATAHISRGGDWSYQNRSDRRLTGEGVLVYFSEKIITLYMLFLRVVTRIPGARIVYYKRSLVVRYGEHTQISHQWLKSIIIDINIPEMRNGKVGWRISMRNWRVGRWALNEYVVVDWRIRLRM